MLSDVYFPRINGVSTSIQTFKNELQQLGHRVILIAPAYPQAYDDDEDVIRIPSRGVLMDPEDRMLKKRLAMKYLPWLRQQNIDLVHIQTPFVAHYLGTRLARELGVPSVVSYHTFFEEYLFHYLPFMPKGFMRYLARHFSRSQCNQVDAVIVPSTAMKETLQAYGVKQSMSIIPTGIQLATRECRREAAQAFRQKLDIAEERPVLVHVGRIAFEKNIDFLIDVVDRVRHEVANLAVIIAGEGPALQRIKQRCADLGLDQVVYFVGYLDRATSLISCYCAGDGFIFSSRTETQGLVLLEAMALGVPVVSTAVMGTRDILAPHKGALVAEDDVADFADKVRTLLEDEVLRKRLSREAKDYVNEWTSREMACRMGEFYTSLAGVVAGSRIKQNVKN